MIPGINLGGGSGGFSGSSSAGINEDISQSFRGGSIDFGNYYASPKSVAASNPWVVPALIAGVVILGVAYFKNK